MKGPEEWTGSREKPRRGGKVRFSWSLSLPAEPASGQRMLRPLVPARETAPGSCDGDSPAAAQGTRGQVCRSAGHIETLSHHTREKMKLSLASIRKATNFPFSCQFPKPHDSDYQVRG